MLLYITFVDFRAFFAQGVHRKVQGQVEACLLYTSDAADENLFV